MTDPIHEQLSACLDGELPPEQTELLLKRLSSDAALHRTAARYSTIGAALRESRGPIPHIDFAARVAQAVAQEQPAQTAPVRGTRIDPRRWLRPALSAAMAAGVATFAILIVNRPDPATQQPVASVAEAPPLAAPAGNATPVAWPAERLANYVVAHSEYSSPLGRTMVLNGLLAEQQPESEPEPAPADSAQP